MAFWQQLKYLLWKNFLLRKRQKLWAIIELLWPLVLFLILVWVRTRDSTVQTPECHYTAKSLPSAGLLPFIQSYFCTIANTCHRYPTTDADVGIVNSDFSFLSILTKQTQKFFGDGRSSQEVEQLLWDVGQIINITNSLEPPYDDFVADVLPYVGNISQLLSPTTPLGQFIYSLRNDFPFVDPGNVTSPFFEMMCGQTTQEGGFQSLFKQKRRSMEQVRERLRGETAPPPLRDHNDSVPLHFADESTGVGNESILCGSIRIIPEEEAECYSFLQDFNIPKNLMIPIFTMLRGFIIISPFSNASAKIIVKIDEWLEGIIALQKVVNDFDLNADNYQNLLNKSSVAKAYQIMEQIISDFPDLEKYFESFKSLNSLFVNSSDPEAALPRLRERFLTLIHFVKCFRTKRFIYVPNERTMEILALCLSDKLLYFSGVSFDFEPTTVNVPPLTTYKIRMANYLTDGTTRVLDRTWSPRDRSTPFIDMKYLYFGFSFLQDAVDRAIIELHSNTTLRTGVYAQQFPNSCYQIDSFIKAIARMLPLCMSLAWVFSASLIVKNVVYEKELRLKEFMKVMGLGNFVHWLAWFIQSFIMIMASVFLFVIIIKYGNIIKKSDPTILLVFLTLYAIATITQCFLISTFFNRANLAAACGAFIYFLLYLPYPVMINFTDVMSYSAKTAACLIAQVSFGWGCSYIAMWEEDGDGLQWSNLKTSPDVYDDFSFFTTMWMLIVDSLIYITLTWYIEAVCPGEYGIPLPFYFPFQRSYWCGDRCVKSSNAAVIEMDARANDSLKGFIEKEPRHLTLGVSVCNLRKVYSNGKCAVDGLNLNFYENQITSFLGHNGAGKTTTMSILTGLYNPSSGTVMVYGKDIRTQISTIRKSLGMCPQHNILLEILTVQETLYFYGGLKGIATNEMKENVKKMIKQLGLIDKKDSLVKDLSGGMQRKLSIAIAFIGDPKLVVLDEPTAGVDPYARRGIWDLLLQHKAGRTIILSTHHMDEADLLGDRIAIISSGRLKCCGSSLFLKKKYGSGYYLTVVCESKSRLSSAKNSFTALNKKTKLSPIQPKKSPQSSDASPTTSNDQATNASEKSVELPSKSLSVKTGGKSPKTSATVKSEALPSISKTRSTPNLGVDNESDPIFIFVTNEVPGAKIVERVGQEIVFSLPSEDPHLLCQFFERLDDQLKTLAISSYGVSETTLEEIFLKSDAQDKADNLENTCCENCYDFLKSKIGRKKNPTDVMVDLMDSSSDDEDGTSEMVLMPGVTKLENHSKCWLLKRQAKALFVKRFLSFLRNKKGIFAEIILPVIVIALTMWGLSLHPDTILEQPPLLLTPWLYSPPNNIFYSLDQSDNVSDAIGRRFLEKMIDPPGLGCRCMPEQPFLDDGLTCSPIEPNDPDRSIFGAESYEDVVINQDLCYCDTASFYKCPSSAYEPDPPNILTNTTDYLYNLTMLNVTQWILMTEKKYRKHRYGGFSLGEVNPVAGADSNWTVIDSNVITVAASLKYFFDQVGLNWSSVREYPWTEVDEANNTKRAKNLTESLHNVLSGLEVKNNVKVWYNNQGWAALPGYVNTLSNAMLRAFLPARENPTDYGIITYNYPMNYSKGQQGQLLAFSYNIGIELTEAVMIVLAFSIVPASFILLLIDEKTSQAKHLQFVSGVDPTLYWVVNFFWDMLNFSIPVVGVMIVFLIFDETAYIGWMRCGVATFLLLYIYGFATIPMMYCFSFVFRIPSLAFVSLAVGNLFLGWISTSVTATLEIVGQDDEELLAINKILMVAFLILPQYCLGRGLLELKIGYYYYLGETVMSDRTEPPNPFYWTFLGRNLLVMAIEGVLAFAVVLFIERRRVRKQKKSVSDGEAPPYDEDDDDVRAEREHVASELSDHSAMKIINLSKEYKKNVCSCTKQKTIRAVDNICVAVERGECFGLLGVNGAGKTTTFKMLTGKTALTSGDAYFGGYSVLKNLDEVRQQIGFCPQFDALNLLLTAREQLEFYARLRGIPEKDVSRIVSRLIKHLGLTVYADRTSSTYSGGNKRKLSTAIALIGNPPVVLLDEPTTGMDPKARRFLWNRINEIVRDGRSVVLTSHSMEECEALCNRIGIMVNGRFQCLGSVQHLKSRFGQGYTLTLKLGGDAPQPDEALRLLKECFPDAVLKEKHLSQLQFQLPAKGVVLSDVFKFVVKVQGPLMVEDYSLCQTTLDEVFIAFAKQQREMGPAIA